MNRVTLGNVGVVVSIVAWLGLGLSVLIRSLAGSPNTATLVSWLSTLVGAVLATGINTLAVWLDTHKKPAVIGLVLSAAQCATLVLFRDILDILLNVFTYS